MTDVNDDPVATAARAAAATLASRLEQPGLPIDVEAALYARGEERRPNQFFDPVALGSLIVSIAALAWQVYSDRKKEGSTPTQETLTRIIRVRRRESSDPVDGENEIIELVAAEIIRPVGGAE
jgi:hypothetical protein